MVIELASGVDAETVDGEILPWIPKLGLCTLDLIVAPYVSGSGHEDHQLETVGSGDWYKPENDEIRFEPATSALTSFWFNIPQMNVDHDLTHVLDVSPKPVSLRLVDRKNFVLRRTRERWVSEDGNFLICLRGGGLGVGECHRFRIAHNVDVIVAEGVLAGWLLERPELFLTNSWRPSSAQVEDRELASILRDYFHLVTDRNVELMENEDVSVREKLESLKLRVDTSVGAKDRRSVIVEAVDDLIDAFY
ncbi:hypothetical protein [Streptoalloteichus tenebrarius]|uniref:hypothetical protein n=1 Tax=Streptoalloteichus tenebrarius (strain ATCC 17920 / DSM 40477 / JCM 4838 / CBS 697.72 / NBRC 16177 / NCIMB 11028 / NRRL B-12390 / A12253. 1 / ISP 5477) TaxID=1933 RepID=UPI0020A46D05|nr:hypothetical protein [Streptoalloteichus tenebrarius]BFF03459.1 hypothetical protein GCM10020241_51340 [Streptoalloteichus tenebrarius]